MYSHLKFIDSYVTFDLLRKNSSLAREPRCDLDVRLALEERVAKISSSTVDKVVQKFLEDYGETIEDCLRDV